MRVRAKLEPERLRPDLELDRLMAELDNEGAVVSFVGVTRHTDNQGQPVSGLYLDHYPGMTEKTLQTIAHDAATRFEVTQVLVIHRCGDIPPGDPIVFAAAASFHRRAAFEAADYLMDRLKTEAAFWKREDGVGCSNWIEPTEADHADRSRWE
jgi:molybdopterin synthase catalytic subunit